MGLMEGLDVEIYNNPLFSAGQMHEIRLGLEAGVDVSSYAKFVYARTDMRKRRLALSEAAYDSNREYIERQIEDEETKLQIIISSDMMDAFMIVSNETKPGISRHRIKHILNLYGISYGYVESGIDRVAKGELLNVRIRVAGGERPTKGRDGYYELFFDHTDGFAPVELSDGSVNYSNKVVENMVIEGQILAHYHEASRGLPGRSVYDVVIAGEEGDQLPPLTGNGITYNEDTKEYTAAEGGFVFYNENTYVLNVWKDYVINGNVNCYTGNIAVDGRLHIIGSVEDGASVSAKGDIVIDGYVAGANVISEQNIMIRSGVNANCNGQIIAGGSVNARFFENASIRAKGNVSGDYFMNCNIETDALVQASGTKSRIMGGNIKAAVGVEATYIGGYMSSNLVLDVGNTEDIRVRITEQKSWLIHIENELMQLRLGKDKIEAKLDEEAREKSTIYGRTMRAIAIEEARRAEANREIERLKRVLRVAESPEIKVRGSMSMDTKVILGMRLRRFDNDVRQTVITKAK